MSSKSEKEKLRLEERATKAFIHAYEQQFHQHIVFLRHNTPAKPDVSCLLSGVEIDFEIAHLYGSEEEAMAHLGRDIPEDTLQELRVMDASQSPEKRLIHALNRLIDKKSQKFYDSDNVWLVICNTHPFWRVLDGPSFKQELTIPNSMIFAQIWLINDIAGEDGIVSLL